MNYAIFLFNQKLVDDSIKLVQNFEMRVQKLRQLPGLDADPDVNINEILVLEVELVNVGFLHTVN